VQRPKYGVATLGQVLKTQLVLAIMVDSDFSFDNFHPDLLLDRDQELALRPVANSRTVQQMVYFVSAVLHEAKTR
jgi:hypothetical protein